MSRFIGTVARGLRTPIFTEGDDLLEMIPVILINAAQRSNFEIKDKDVLAITESVVARAQGNYASIYDIETDLKNKLQGQKVLGLTFPILSRNRFSTLLKGFARSVDEIIIQFSYPADEVGNHLFSSELLFEKNVNPYHDVFNEEEFSQTFGKSKHPFTHLDYVELYRDIVEKEGATCRFVFANDIREILKYTKNVLTCDIHSRHRSKKILEQAGAEIVLTLEDLLNQENFLHGYNPDYGLLGSNKASDQRIKLFPRDNQKLVESLQARIFELTGKTIEVMVYGDGAFKDPVGQIWELADPVVSPGFTSGLLGTPQEIKLKYLADNEFVELTEEQQQKAIKDRIEQNRLMGSADAALGTTPRQLTDLLGSLADLTSGSGDKGTPIVYIQGYFDSFAD